MTTTIVKLKAGETVLVAATDPNLGIGGGPVVPPTTTPTPPVDPGYGVDVGLGPIRPAHPIVLPPTTPPTEPTPPEPVDPGWGIDVDEGYVRPEHPIYLPPPPKPGLGWKTVIAWTPVTGWIVVAVPTGPHVTPSKK